MGAFMITDFGVFYKQCVGDSFTLSHSLTAGSFYFLIFFERTKINDKEINRYDKNEWN